MKLLCLVRTLELHFDSDKSLWEITPDVDIMAHFLAKQSFCYPDLLMQQIPAHPACNPTQFPASSCQMHGNYYKVTAEPFLTWLLVVKLRPSR